MIALPLLVFFLATVLIRPHRTGWRDTMALTTTLLAAGVALVNELASCFQLLLPSVVRLTWGATALILAVLLLHRRSTGRLHQPSTRQRTNWWFVLLLPLPVFAAALLWPPNNYDCMVYHLPRIYAWAQNASVAHFPTAISRQLYQPPLFEYLLVHLKLLGAPDAFFNLLAASALVGAGLVASLIVEHGARQAWAGPLAFALVVTLPSAALQGSNPKNDICLGLWCLASFHFILDFHTTGKRASLFSAILTMALAILTKGTAWILLPPLGAFLLLAVFRFRADVFRGQKLVRTTILAAGLAAGLLIPHHIRNQITYDNPLGPVADQGEAQYGNVTHSIRTVVSNLIRNAALEMQTPWPALNACIQKPVLILHTALHQDLNSPETTWPGTRFDVAPPVRWHEDMASNPVACLILAAAGITVLFVRGSRNSLLPVALGVTTLVACLLFCALLRWQPWHSRLHIPIFFLGLTFATLIATVWPPWLRLLLATASVAAGLFAVFVSESRPLLHLSSLRSRTMECRMFQNNAGLFHDYEEAATRILKDRPQTLGLMFGLNDWEYPIWHWLERSPSRPKVLHWLSTDPIRPPAPLQPWPSELLVSIRNRGLLASLGDHPYILVFANQTFEIYRDRRTLAPGSVDPILQMEFSGNDWYDEESAGEDRWRWSRGESVIRLIPGESPPRWATVRGQISVFGRSQRITITDEAGNQLWSAEVPPNVRRDFVISRLALHPLGTILRLTSNTPPTPAGGTDSRALAFALFNPVAVKENEP